MEVMKFVKTSLWVIMQQMVINVEIQKIKIYVLVIRVKLVVVNCIIYVKLLDIMYQLIHEKIN